MQLSNCRRCDQLVKTRTQVVLGFGSSHQPRVMFIGEAPGREEDRRGRPFVGPAGKWLDRIMKTLGLSFNVNTYVTNVIRCRPVDEGRNRKPMAEEVGNCWDWLDSEIKQIKPKMIVLLGGAALVRIIPTERSIMQARGTLYDIDFKHTVIPVFPMMHPACLLYDKEGNLPLFKQDIKKLKGILDGCK